jgi:hypothetical protein
VLYELGLEVTVEEDDTNRLSSKNREYKTFGDNPSGLDCSLCIYSKVSADNLSADFFEWGAVPQSANDNAYF